MTSAERDSLVTLVCACNAIGVFLSPMYIFPKKWIVALLYQVWAEKTE